MSPRPRPAAAPAAVTTASIAAPPAPTAQPRAAAADDSAPIPSASLDVVLEAVFENDTRRFEQCHPGWKRPTDADAAAARKRAKDKPRTLLRRWIVCAPATTLPTAQPNEIRVRVLDADTANAGGGGDDGYTTFYVLGASEEQAVLGTTHQGETHLRLVSTCFLPLDTMTAVFKCRRHMADEC
jgi:hypothetical protein